MEAEWIREGECNRCGDCCQVIDMIGKKFGPCSLYKEGEGCTDRQHPYYLRKCAKWPYRPDQIGWVEGVGPTRFPRCSYTFRRVVKIHVQVQ